MTQFSWNLLAPLPSKWHPQWAQSLTISILSSRNYLPHEPLKIAQKPNHPLPTPNKKIDLKLWSQNFNNNIKSRNTCMRNIKGMRLPISTLLEYYGTANVLPVSLLIISPGPVVTKFTNPSTPILNRNVHKGAKTRNWGRVLAFGNFVTTGPVLNLCYWHCCVWHLMCQTYGCCCCCRQYYRWRMTPAKLYGFAGPHFYWWCTWSEICGVVAL